MRQLTSFEMWIDHCSFNVSDPEIGGQPSDLYFDGSYSFVNGFAIFFTCSECSHAQMEVWLADKMEMREDTRWAIVIPFAVGESGIEIDSLLPKPIRVAIPKGHYALLYEVKLRYNKLESYFKRLWAKLTQRDSELQDAFCRLTFIPQKEVKARELMPMHWSLRGLKSEAEDIVPIDSE